MAGVVSAIYRYPVKGLSAEALESVEVKAGEALPYDRAWAIENGPSRFDAEAPRHLPPVSFLMLMRDERLAALDSRFDETTQRLTLLRGGRTVATGDLGTPIGRQVIEQFIAAFMADSLRGRPRIVSAAGHTFSDVPEKRVHLINLATLREIERVIGRAIDPLRFRPNIVVDGAAPWAEFGWIGGEVACGPVRLKVWEKTDRCAATNVDPKTGVRDINIPAVLGREWGHVFFGVYAEILDAGTLTIGAALTV